MTVDVLSLVWVRSSAQTTANLAAASVALEIQRNPSAPVDYLRETARATAAWNGYRDGVDATAVQLDRQDGKTSVLIEREAGVYFLRMIRPQPVPVRARAAVAPGASKAAL